MNTFVCVKPGIILQQDDNLKKVGRLSYNWWEKGIEDYWNWLIVKHYTYYKDEAFGPTNQKQSEAIQIAAKSHWGLDKELQTIEQVCGIFDEPLRIAVRTG